MQGWLDRHIARCERLGFGLWAVVLKETGAMIGQCGLTLQSWENEEVLEIGYLFERRHWHKGYAAEAAAGCKKYAFEVLGAHEVCSIVRDTNTAAQNVAIRNGMVKTDESVKNFRGIDMRFCRYTAADSGYGGHGPRRMSARSPVCTGSFLEGIGAALAFFDISRAGTAGTARGGCPRGRLCSV